MRPVHLQAAFLCCFQTMGGHFKIVVVFFYADKVAACLLASLTCRAAAHGEIQNGVAWAAVSLNQVGQ